MKKKCVLRLGRISSIILGEHRSIFRQNEKPPGQFLCYHEIVRGHGDVKQAVSVINQSLRQPQVLSTSAPVTRWYK